MQTIKVFLWECYYNITFKWEKTMTYIPYFTCITSIHSSCFSCAVEIYIEFTSDVSMYIWSIVFHSSLRILCFLHAFTDLFGAIFIHLFILQLRNAESSTYKHLSVHQAMFHGVASNEMLLVLTVTKRFGFEIFHTKQNGINFRQIYTVLLFQGFI